MKTKPLIVFVSPTLEVHGGTAVMARYANFLVGQGYRVAIVAPRTAFQIKLKKAVELRLYPKFPIKWIDFFSFQLVYARAIIRRLSDANVIIPIYLPLLVPIVLAFFNNRIKAKIIMFCQDSLESLWTGNYMAWLLRQTWLTQKVAFWIAVSHPLAKQYRKITGRKMAVILNGVDTNIFHPRKRSVNKNYLLFVGRPNRAKGIDLLKAAFRKIKSQYPALGLKIVYPGAKPRKFGSVEYVTYKSQQQLARLYGQAVILVMPSRAESFGLPALEAMASGTPAIVSDTLGIRQYARSGINALVVPVADIDQLSRAIGLLLGSKKLRDKLIAGGKKTALQYQWKRYLNTFLKMIDRAIIGF